MKIVKKLKNFSYKEIKKKFFNKKDAGKKEKPELTFGYNEQMEEYVEYYQLATRWK